MSRILQRISTITLPVFLIMAYGCDSGGTQSSEPSTQAERQVISVDTTEAALVSAAEKISGGNVAESGSDFDYPDTSITANGLALSIPGGPLPSFSGRRTLSKGAGNSLGFGDPVVLKYDMFSWSSGELVETSSQLDGALVVKAGVAENVPEYLATSLLGRNIGDKLQIVFPQGMEDLPDYLDAEDSYVLVVELL